MSIFGNLTIGARSWASQRYVCQDDKNSPSRRQTCATDVRRILHTGAASKRSAYHARDPPSGGGSPETTGSYAASDQVHKLGRFDPSADFLRPSRTKNQRHHHLRLRLRQKQNQLQRHHRSLRPGAFALSIKRSEADTVKNERNGYYVAFWRYASPTLPGPPLFLVHICG
jgi:hypothetical protein